MKILPDRQALIAEIVSPGSIGGEIGVYRGEFSKELLARGPSKLYLIDAWESYKEYDLDSINREDQNANLQSTKENVWNGLQNGTVEIIKGFSTKVAASWKTPLKWIFLDANHGEEFVEADLKAWAPHIEKDGFIMCHDYTESSAGAIAMNFGVVKAVDRFCLEHGWIRTHLTQELDWPSVAIRRA